MAILKQPATGVEAEALKGGEGSAKLFRTPLSEDKMGPIRLAARIELEPGASVGSHVHEDDEEAYAIFSGEGIFIGDGEEVPARPGDIFVTRQGHGHSLHNTGTEPLIFFAVVAKE